jgi:hypothetical protein
MELSKISLTGLGGDTHGNGLGWFNNAGLFPDFPLVVALWLSEPCLHQLRAPFG